MAKLTSVRISRRYGYPQPFDDIAELINSLFYVLATTLLLSALSFELNEEHERVVPWLVMTAVAILTIVNLHDLMAQLAGFDFRLPLLTSDPQLALVEILSPVLQTIGFLLLFAGFLTVFIARDGTHGKPGDGDADQAGRQLLVAGPVFVLTGNVLNNFQVYERLDLASQAEQHAVSIPMTLGALLFLVSGIIGLVDWPKSAWHIAKDLLNWFAVAGAILWFIASVLNVDRVIRIQESDALGIAEPLRGGAAEQLEAAREQHTPLMETPHMETASARPVKESGVSHVGKARSYEAPRIDPGPRLESGPRNVEQERGGW